MRLPTLAEGPGCELPPISLAAFSDDIELPQGGRAGVRVCITGGRLDFRDSDRRSEHNDRFALPVDLVEVAATLAFGHALDVEATRGLAEQLELSVDRTSWIGADSPSVTPATAMGMARVYDAVLGALAQAWPDVVGAGSCSLGAVVEFDAQGEQHLEVVPGGEGATPRRPGISGWAGPILSQTAAQWPAWLAVAERTRVGSGGGGARLGGDGVVRAYDVSADARVVVSMDRRTNPPHGIDRAGPPEGARAVLVTPTGDESSLPPWTDVAVPAGHTVRIETAGGAGHGFGGYGDISFDPGDWFGAS